MDTKCLHNYYIKDYEIGHVTVYIKFKDEIALLTATKKNVKKNEKHETYKAKNINYFRPILTLLSRQVVTHTERPTPMSIAKVEIFKPI